MDTICTGTVADFDEARGIGHVQPEDGTVALSFHCTQLADASRTILPGTLVTYEVRVGLPGRWEAGAVTRR